MHRRLLVAALTTHVAGHGSMAGLGGGGEYCGVGCLGEACLYYQVPHYHATTPPHAHTAPHPAAEAGPRPLAIPLPPLPTVPSARWQWRSRLATANPPHATLPSVGFALPRATGRSGTTTPRDPRAPIGCYAGCPECSLWGKD
eukprot:gene7565-7068_t